jgi:cyanophycinase
LLWINPGGVEDAVLVIADELPADARREFDELAGMKKRRIARIDSYLLASYHLPFQCCRGPLNDELRRDLSRRLSSTSFIAVIDDGTALAVVGREIHVLGRGSVTIALAAGPGRPLREIILKNGSRSDLTMFRRAARERSLGSFPSMAPAPPVVPSGTLLIHGGGEVPDDVLQKFIGLAGGQGAPIVVLPIAAADELSGAASQETRLFTRAGATNVKSLRARSREEIDSPEFELALKKARGVWFSGGRQWRFVDAYLGTQAEALFQDVLARGGVIGGSSAGASIQGEYMPRGSPLGNAEMMAEGYERGLGFLPGVAMDQHFTQRQRHADMTSLMRVYPQLLGIGLDEGTAIVVQQSTARIMGRGQVHFYDYRTGEPTGEKDFVAAHAGQAYDLAARKIVRAD